MGDDDGQDGEGVVVPLSMIRLLAESILDTIDQWHEERGIHCLNTSQCVVAMLAAVDAAAEAIHNYPDGMTMQ